MGDGGVGGKREAGGGRELSTFHLKPAPKRRSAFTLIELLGVMAIIGILSAVVLPPMIARIEDAQTTNEDAKLEEIARALVKGIQAEGRIPNPNTNPTASGGWAAMATNYSVLGTNDLILSVPRATNETVRRYFLSPALTNFLGGSYSPPAGGWSTNNFTNGPFYLMLVSVSKEGLLFAERCTTNTNMASNDIVFLQNWGKTNNTNGRVEVTNLNIVGNIAGTTDRWTNRGQFLHVKVVDLRQLFCSIQLEDTAAPVVVDMATNGSGYTAVPSTTNTKGTTINYQTNGASTNVQILNYFPAQRQSGLTNRGTNSSSTTNQVDIASIPTTWASNRVTTPGAPQFALGTNTAVTIPDQVTNFYTIYGSSLRLISPTNRSTNTSIIQKDVQFEFYGGNWRQLY